MRCTAGIVALLVCPAVAWGYTSRVTFRRISIEQGLSQSTVRCILQDRAGFVWLGTSDGLNRYDGYRITELRHDPRDPTSLGNNRISVLLEDSRGVLWVGTVGGLNRLDRNRPGAEPLRPNERGLSPSPPRPF